MIVGIAHTALIVREYEEAIEFYGKLGFKVVENTLLPSGKRWVRLAVPGGHGSEILLSRAVNEEQLAAVGNQTGGRVLFFMHSDDFESDYKAFCAEGIEFTEGPLDQVHGWHPLCGMGKTKLSETVVLTPHDPSFIAFIAFIVTR